MHNLLQGELLILIGITVTIIGVINISKSRCYKFEVCETLANSKENEIVIHTGIS